MKTFSLQRHSFCARELVFVSSNLRSEINFAFKWSMQVFLAVHLIKKNNLLALTAFVAKKGLVLIISAAIKPFLKNNYLKITISNCSITGQ